MRPPLFVLAITLVAWVCPLAGQSSDADALRAELERTFAALGEGNGSFFRSHYVPEVSRIHLGGGVDLGWNTQKADRLTRAFESGFRAEIEEFDLADLRVYGDFGITAGTARMTQTLPSREAEVVEFRFSYVWMRVDGSWREIHHHVSVTGQS